MNKRTKSLVWSGVTVAVLAVVVFGGWALSAPKKQAVAPTIKLTQQQRSSLAYEMALKALQSGDTTAAIAQLKSSVSDDPNNADAKSKLAQLTGSDGTPSPQTPTKPTTTPSKVATSPPSAWLLPTAKMAVLLPAAYEGYTMGQPLAEGPFAQVPGSPSGRPLKVSHIEWSVYDKKTAQGARAFLADTTKTLYNKGVAGVTVAGTPGSFGVDMANHLAAVTFLRGRYVFETVLTPQSGTGEDLSAEAQAAAAAFPTAKP